MIRIFKMERMVFSLLISSQVLSLPALASNTGGAEGSDPKKIELLADRGDGGGNSNDDSADRERREREERERREREQAYDRGYRQGFSECQNDEERKAYNDGYRVGLGEGQWPGDREGRSNGDRDGQNNGESEGYADGRNRANSDARRDAYPRGREQGYDEANRSDALARGRANGISRGDSDAAATALRVDYPRGRKAYSDSRWAERVEREDGMVLKSSHAPVAFAMSSFLNSFKTSEIFVADSGDAYQNGRRAGCAEARSRNYRGDYERGRSTGYREAYDRAYRFAYDSAYRSAYDSAFRSATARAYSNHYDDFYDDYFEEARSAAYSERYNELYQSTYQPAYRAKYNEMYPIYAQRQYERGVADETEDFRLRPVRLLDGAEVTETIVNGLYEPGEALRVKLKLRNFADVLRGSDVKIKLTAVDGNGAIISEGEVTLPKNLNAKSITTVSEALDFRMSEGDVKAAAFFNLNLTYQSRNIGSKMLRVDTKFLLNVDFAQDPRLQEGIMSPLYLKVTNQSPIVALESGATVTLRSNPAIVEIAKETLPLGVLGSGQSVTLEYSALVRSGRSFVDLPFTLDSATSAGRRIGLNDYTRQVPVMNDYRVQVMDSGVVPALRKAGIVRVPYRIKNVSSRQTFKGLQMKTVFKGAAANAIAVLGPNPQYLQPLQQGQQTDFVVPVLVQKAGTSGTMEITIQEDGQTVVIHQINF